MIENNILCNINPLINLAQNILMILGGFTLMGIIIFLIYSHKNINVFINQNNRLIDKFPLVSADFYKKSNTEQNAENNQEIHEINQKIEKIEGILKALQSDK